MTSTVPIINVGIIASTHITLTLHGKYACPERYARLTHIELDAADIADEIIFTPSDDSCYITISDVVIGIDFHWARHENQSFHGTIRVMPIDGKLQIINSLDVETYLQSVVSSEMNANAPEEFLKAHAVISRSWVLAQINPPLDLSEYKVTETSEETIRWYDHDAHKLFDVCADDHCQRYQGCTKASTPQVKSALEATRGQVLTHDGNLCDARFSKCCGGITEKFSTCWQPIDLPYLQAEFDAPQSSNMPDVANEQSAHGWITSRPDAYCANPSSALLKRVLNYYDLETPDFYRWQVEYTGEELAEIIRTRSGIDYGRIISLRPLHRGASGRIDRLEITGTRCHKIIGKELEIRRTLSASHLYSSAFIVQSMLPDESGTPTRWRITGAGWGHGVGLCQIGAAVMADRGADYQQILRHYFHGTEITIAY